MLAARYDTGTEWGSGWRRTLRRRTRETGTADLAMAEPITIEVWDSRGAVDDRDRPRPPKVTASGSVSLDRLTADVRLTAEQVKSLGIGSWEYALTITDPATGEPDVLARGYFLVSGSVDRL